MDEAQKLTKCAQNWCLNMFSICYNRGGATLEVAYNIEGGGTT